MPYLDVYRLFFDVAATIEDEASVFGKEWRSTLDYVLSQPGLEAAYTSKPSVQDGLWVFLVWQTEKDREHFFHQSTGFGFVSGYMTNTPAVYFYGEDAYDELDATKTWVIDVIIAVTSGIQELQLPEPKSRYSFVGQQERAVVEKLYQGNHFGDVIFGLMQSDHSEEKYPQSKHTWARYILEFGKRAPALYPDCRTTEVPVNIAGLIEKQPWEYGLISYDTSIYSSLDYPSTAHPLSLTFQPMCTMDVPDEPLGESEHRGDGELEIDSHHITCIISLLDSPRGASEPKDKAIEEIRNKLGLQNDTLGLREVRVLRGTSVGDNSQTTQLICAWHSSENSKQWQQAITNHKDVRLECSWSSKRGDLSLLEWDSMPLTPDHQSWQKLDKILEVVEFAFEKGLSPAEKKAFEHRIYAFTSTMSSCWSSGVDERPVVYAEEPVWTLSEGAPSRCVLLVAWDGVEQRKAWFTNFMANGFNWTGHLAHMLGSVCNLAESRTYSMEKLRVEHVPLNTPGGVGDKGDGSESDSDMGF